MKKGFTLIELIAIIVVLGVVALITIPQVQRVIDESKKESAEVSAKRYVDAVNGAIQNGKITRNNMVSDGVKDIYELDIEVDGEAPTDGTVTISDGAVKYSELVVGDYTITCNLNDCVTIKGYYVYHSTTGTLENYKEASRIRPIASKVYLKYPIINDKVEVPRVCYYDGKIEYCLNYKEYEKTLEKVKMFYDFNERLWIVNENKWYKSENNDAIYCENLGDGIACYNGKIGMSFKSNGYVNIGDQKTTFGCTVNEKGQSGCGPSVN